MSTFTIPETQRAALITAFDAPYAISTSHPVPSPSTLASNQCLIKMLVSGCCHSDMHIRKGEWRTWTKALPAIGGHEGVGIVVALGGGDGDKGIAGGQGAVKLGDRVGVKWTANACGMCELYRTGFDSRTFHLVLLFFRFERILTEAPVFHVTSCIEISLPKEEELWTNR